MKVGIALATYNPEMKFFREQIESLRDQTFSNWVCVISDDSSNSYLSTEIKELIQLDSRFSYSRNPSPLGVYLNFENALKQLPNDVDFICFSDQDDIWAPEKIAALIENLRETPAAFVIHSDLKLIDKDKKQISESCWTEEKREIDSRKGLLSLVLRNRVTGCSMMFRQSILKMALPFPDGDNCYLHDHWIATLGQTESDIINFNQPLTLYRQHSGNVIGASQKSGSHWTEKLKKLAQLSSKSKKALKIRQQLSWDLITRVQKFDRAQAEIVKQDLEPLLKPSPLFFLKELLKTRFHWPEFGLYLQLFIGSFISDRPRD